MTCAKKQVHCTIHTAMGAVYGNNDCANPQPVCPREPGEGYEKCKSICQQAGHAEEMALLHAKQRDFDVKGATAVLYGHSHYCRKCQEALFDAGVVALRRAKMIDEEPEA
jgi:deoxycytidylate deaminase